MAFQYFAKWRNLKATQICELPFFIDIMPQTTSNNRQSDDPFKPALSFLGDWSFPIAWVCEASLAVLGLVFVSLLAADGVRVSPLVSSIIGVLSVAIFVVAVAKAEKNNLKPIAVSLGSLVLLDVILWSICVANLWALVPFGTSVLFLVSLVATGLPGLIRSDDVSASDPNERLPIDTKAAEVQSDVSMTLPLELFESNSAEDEDTEILQSFYRTISDGIETLSGSCKVLFESQKKSSAIHIPFWPPVDGVSQVECETVDAENCEAKASSVLANGLRIEVKRKGTLLDQQLVTVEWSVSASGCSKKSGQIEHVLIEAQKKEAL